jgi:hypothetical protein
LGHLLQETSAEEDEEYHEEEGDYVRNYYVRVE